MTYSSFVFLFILISVLLFYYSSLWVFGFFMFNMHVKHKLNAKLRSTVPNDVCNSFFSLIFSSCFTKRSILTFIGADCSQVPLACFKIAMDSGLKNPITAQRCFEFGLTPKKNLEQPDTQSINDFGFLHFPTFKS